MGENDEEGAVAAGAADQGGSRKTSAQGGSPVIGSTWIRGLGGSRSCACPPPPPGTPLWVLVEAAALSVLAGKHKRG